MLMEKERLLLIEYGKKLVEAGLTKGTGGNLSIFDRKNGHVAITPSGIDFFEIQPEDIVIIDVDGNIIEGNRVPSSEWAMHVMPYKYRDDIDAVIHAHTMYATVMACLREDLPATHYMIAVAGENVRVAKYATYGSPELAKNAFEAMKDRKAVILANHGILAGANVVMPNLSPLKTRKKYELYDGKVCTGDEAAHCIGCITKRINNIGYKVAKVRGDSKCLSMM